MGQSTGVAFRLRRVKAIAIDSIMSSTAARIEDIRSLRPTAKARRPQIQDCAACDGRGRTSDVDSDEYGSWTVTVRCEACQGSGMTTSCVRCLDVVSLPEAEEGSGHCCSCRIELETVDADEARRVGR